MSDDPRENPGAGGAADEEPRRFATHAARLMADSRCEEVLVLDLRGVSSVADFFVLGTGTSDRQIKSVAEDLVELARHEERGVSRLHGVDSAQWLVADFIDVVVHLFNQQMRAYYDLESLWSDAGRIDWQSTTRPGQFAQIGSRRGGG